MIERPSIKSAGGNYLLTYADLDIDVEATRLYESSRGETSAEILIKSRRAEFKGHVHRSRLNLTASRSKVSWAKDLGDRYRWLANETWRDVLEYACELILRQHRLGEPVQNLAEFPGRDALRHKVHPFIEERQPTVLFGEGDSGKSWLGLLLAYQVASGRSHLSDIEVEPGGALYLDYETDFQTMAERVDMISAGLNEAPPDIPYRRMTQLLAHDFQALSEIVLEKRVSLLIVDSAAPAVGEPEGSAPVTEYFKALRALGAASLTIAHVSKTGQETHPFGSIFWRNLPRSNFRALGQTEPGDVGFTIGLKHTKSNNGRRIKDRAYRFSFDDESVVIEKAEPESVSEIVERMTIGQRIEAALKAGSMTASELATELEMSENTVRTTCNREAKKGKLVNVHGGRWGLPYEAA